MQLRIRFSTMAAMQDNYLILQGQAQVYALVQGRHRPRSGLLDMVLFQFLAQGGAIQSQD